MKRALPKGNIIGHRMSHLVLGGNLIGGWAHPSDLIYVPLLLTGILPVTFSAAFTSFTASAKEKQPNILFIMIDDLRPDLNCYGNQQIISPNIDNLARAGVLFERAYVQQAICMASRASILKGYRANEQKIYSCPSVEDLTPGVETLNRFFENNGYNVSAKGKIV